MATRGVYSEEEKKMLAKFDETADSMYGWRKPLIIPVATKDSINAFALAVDCWNPLWRDESYATSTRWGGIIAPFGYLDAIAQITWHAEVPPSVGFPGGQWLGEDWEIYKQVHVDDSFRVWCRRPKLVDITSPDGKGLRAFQFHAHDVDIFNQRDELIVKFKLYLDIIVYTEKPPAAEHEPDYVYTKEELAFIDRVFKEEEILGAEIRWWEDVSVGEELRPVIMGPTTLWDQIVYTHGRGEMDMVPMMEMRRRGKFLQLDPATGVTHHGIEFHHADLTAHLRGLPKAIHYGVVSRQLLARCVTNWMGDDGYIKNFKWRHLGHFFIGDTAVGRGKVINKRVENGEHLVDISLWLENLRGHVTVPALATVSLVSKEAI